MIDAVASSPHYAEHLQPIWDALPTKGTFTKRSQGKGLVLVASLDDLRKCNPRPAVLVEHGAGQTYVDNRTPAGYAGGPGRGRVRLFVCPNERVAGLNARAYPQSKVVVGSPRVERLRTIARQPEKPVVSFHWDCRVSPEARTAWPHYWNFPPVDVLGHGHPRAWGQYSRWWTSIGVEPVASFDDVIRRASVYAVDNSSTLYEAAACGIPVVALNAPWYRRDVNHGLRFWERVPLQVDGPEELAGAFADAGLFPVDDIYPNVEGSTRRVVSAILELFG